MPVPYDYIAIGDGGRGAIRYKVGTLAPDYPDGDKKGSA